MTVDSDHTWLDTWMQAQEIKLWGIADLRDFDTLKDANGQRFPCAISWVVPMNPQIMAGISPAIITITSLLRLISS